MKNINKAKTITLAYLGAILSFVGILIFMLLPNSDFTNSVNHSGMDAVKVLTLSPVCVLLGGAIFMFAFLKDYKIWNNFLSDTITKGATIFFIVAVIFNLAVTISFYASQLSLGFVSPFDGLIYESLSIISIVITILQLIFSTLATAAIIRNSK